MTWLRVLFIRVAGFFRSSSADARLAEEIAAHLDFLAADFERRGLSPSQSRLAARREFGGELRIAETHRTQRGLPFLDALTQDLRYAARQLLSNPGFSITAILTLALGIGANTAIFSVLDAVVLRTLPVPHPEQLVVVDAFRGSTNTGFSYPLFREVAARQQSLRFLSAAAELPLESFDLGPGRPLDGVNVRMVTGDYFAMLEISPHLGRLLDATDDQPSAPRSAVISDSFWRNAFGADPAVPGRTLRMNRASFVIVGVAPQGFFGETVGSAPDVWLSLAKAGELNAGMTLTRSSKVIAIMGRLRPDVSSARAQTELAALCDRLEQLEMQIRGVAGAHRVVLTPAAQGGRGSRTQFSRPLQFLMITVGLVLLIACFNLANLLMARGAARFHEIGVRLAIGASRARLLRQLLTESLLLAAAGASLGLLLARWGSRQLVALAASGGPLRIDARFDGRVLVFTIVVSGLAVCLFGLAPAVAATHLRLYSAVQSSPRTAAENRGRTLLSKALVVAQISLSLLLVSSSALFMRSFWNLFHQDFGYRPDGVVLAVIPLGQPAMALSRNPSRPRILSERLRALPGVLSVSFSTTGPLSEWRITAPVSVPGRPARATENIPRAFVSQAYFDTLRIPILAGRVLTAADCESKADVAVLSETAARTLFAGENPIGRRISESPQFQTEHSLQVVGVVRDVRSLNPRDAADYLIYLPQQQPLITSIQLRTATDPQNLVPSVRRTLEDAGLGNANVRPLWDAMRAKAGREHLLAVVSGAFGALALVLASVGLYGVVSYTVARRTREIGIRSALGATRAQISALFLRDAGVLLAAGLLFGGGATLPLARSVRALLFGIVPNDPAMLSAAALALTLVAAVASFIPARRAARLNPTQALRQE